MNEKIWIIIIAIYTLLQVFAFFLYGLDKARSKRANCKNRISERFLLQMAVIAPIGTLLGMKLFHHKTKKSKFIIWNFLMLMIHLLCLFLIFRHFNG